MTRHHTIAILPFLLIWLIMAVIVGYGGFLNFYPAPFPHVVLMMLTIFVGFLTLLVPSMRDWAARVPLRWLLLPHLFRFMGIYLLYLGHHRRLYQPFAVPAGKLDLAVGLLALLLILTATPKSVWWWALLAWNVIGLAEMFYLVRSAGWANRHFPQSMRELVDLPLSLLPTFIVPLIFVTHIVLFVRLWNSRFYAPPITEEAPESS